MGTCCAACGFTPKNPNSTLYFSAMFEQVQCVNGVACKRRQEKAKAAAAAAAAAEGS